MGWYQKALANSDAIDNSLDRWMGTNGIQRIYDQTKIKAPWLQAFNRQLDSRNSFGWELAKVPVKVIRNFVSLPVMLTKGAAYMVFHPLKGVNQIGRIFAHAIHNVQDERNWTKIGGGLVGASVGQEAALGLPFATVRMGIGTAFIIAGIAVSVLQAKEGQHLQELGNQLADLTTSFLVGAGCGYLIGRVALYNAMAHAEKAADKVYDQQDPIYATHPVWTDKYLDQNGRFHFVNSPFKTGIDENGVTFMYVYKSNTFHSLSSNTIIDRLGNQITISDPLHGIANNPGEQFTLDPTYRASLGLAYDDPSWNAIRHLPENFKEPYTIDYLDISPSGTFNGVPATLASTATTFASNGGCAAPSKPTTEV